MVSITFDSSRSAAFLIFLHIHSDIRNYTVFQKTPLIFNIFSLLENLLNFQQTQYVKITYHT